MPIFDPYNQAHLTAVVQVQLRTRMEQLNPVVNQLVHQQTTTEDKIKLEKSEVKAFGYAQPKAFGATPNIYVPKIRYTETEIELLPMHEMSPVSERLLRKLQSKDPDIVLRAGADIGLRTTALQVRNEVGWNVLTMGAIMTGQMVVNFKDEPGQGLLIDYDYDSSQFASASSDWGDRENSTPIDDMMAIQLAMANSIGDYGINFWMNSNTMRDIVWSKQAKDLLTGFDGRAQYIPDIQDIRSRMYEPGRVTFNVSDSGYRPDETYERGLTAHTKYIPDNKVIVTTDDPFEGENLVDVFSGLTAVPVSEFAAPALREGPQSWIKLNTESLDTYYHVASTKMPRINRPDCIYVLDTTGE